MASDFIEALTGPPVAAPRLSLLFPSYVLLVMTGGGAVARVTVGRYAFGAMV